MQKKITGRNTFQFTPLREGRPSGCIRSRSVPISIHAPPRGATKSGRKCSSFSMISIHAPPRGATHMVFSIPKFAILFQFTPLREGRQIIKGLGGAAKTYFNSRPSARGDTLVEKVKKLPDISIHAPPRGATTPAAQAATHKPISIHAPPRGATGDDDRPRREDEFQFTPLREGRLCHACVGISSLPYFNSRPSARGDGKRYAISANLLFNPYKSAWLNNSATQFVEIILVIFHRIIA